MKSLSRDHLIEKINSTEFKNVLIPTDILGKRSFLKTPKNALIRMLRTRYKTDQDTGLRFKPMKSLGGAVIESVNAASEILVKDKMHVHPNQSNEQPVKRGRGRPRIHPRPEERQNDQGQVTA